jgi:hypothetical protein
MTRFAARRYSDWRRHSGVELWESRRERTMGAIETSLHKILSLRLCNEGLELSGGEGVYETGLRANEEDLCKREGRQLVGLELY